MIFTLARCCRASSPAGSSRQHRTLPFLCCPQRIFAPSTSRRQGIRRIMCWNMPTERWKWWKLSQNSPGGRRGTTLQSRGAMCSGKSSPRTRKTRSKNGNVWLNRRERNHHGQKQSKSTVILPAEHPECCKSADQPWPHQNGGITEPGGYRAGRVVLLCGSSTRHSGF